MSVHLRLCYITRMKSKIYFIYRSLSSDPISKPFLFKNILTKTIKNNEKFTLLLSGNTHKFYYIYQYLRLYTYFWHIFSVLENSVKKVGIIINSLSAVLSHQNIAVVCKDLYEVINYRTQSNVHLIFVNSSVFQVYYNIIYCII